MSFFIDGYIDSMLTCSICNLFFLKLFFNFREIQYILRGPQSLASFLRLTSIMVSYSLTLLVCVKPLFFISDLYMAQCESSIKFCLINLGTTQPVHPANAVENEFNVAAPSATCSAIDRMKEQPKIGEGSFLDSNKLIDNSIQVGTDLGFQGSSDDKIAIIQSNFDSKSNFGKKQEVDSFNFLSCFHLFYWLRWA